MQPIIGASKVLMTGGSGRIGTQLKKSLSTKHHVIEIKRGHSQNSDSNSIQVVDPTSLTVREWKALMQDNAINIVFNLAAQSSGSLKSMVAVNVTMPENMAKACNELGIHMVHTCSHSAELNGLDVTDFPYAATKRMAAESVKENPHVVIARLGAVLGGASDVPVCSDAAISTWSPFIMLPGKDGEQEFFPVDEATTIEAMTKIVDYLADPTNAKKQLPKVIDIAGKEVKLKTFLKMINPTAIASIKLPAVALNLLATLVNKGVFTKEFMNISKVMRSEKNRIKPDTSAMENILGVAAPTPEKVAQAAGKQLSLVKTSSLITKALLENITKKTQQTLPQGVWPTNFLDKASLTYKLFSSKNNQE